MLKHIPNIITSLNVLCGCVAVIFAVSGDLITASFFVFFGIFFDFFDGFAARMFRAQSDLGLQLDSLADMITSGLAPSIVMVQLLSKSISGEYLILTAESFSNTWESYLPFVGLLIAVASAYRLAKFNIDTRQTTSFIGLPTPANALLILSLPLILQYQNSEMVSSIVLNQWVLIGITLVSSMLLNAEIPLFALKFKTWDVKSNTIRYIFLGVSILAIVLFWFMAIPLIIAFYIVLSLFRRENRVS